MEKKENKEVKETKTTAKKPTAKKATEKKPATKKSAEKKSEPKQDKTTDKATEAKVTEEKTEAKVTEVKQEEQTAEQTTEPQTEAETASTDGFAEITPETENKELSVLYHLTDGGDVRVSMAISHNKWQMHIITKRKESYQNGLVVAFGDTERADKVEAMKLLQMHFDKVVEYCKTHKLVFVDTEPTVEVVGL